MSPSEDTIHLYRWPGLKGQRLNENMIELIKIKRYELLKRKRDNESKISPVNKRNLFKRQALSGLEG